MRRSFQIIVLGCTGGPRETNLSGYLLSPIDPIEWIALDAGTLLSGIDHAFEKDSLDEIPFSESTELPETLFYAIKAYLISHAHLDHIAGLVINSQVDCPKAILGIDPTIDNLRDHIFNGIIWPNYGNEGIEPINRYHYIRLPLHAPQPIAQTSMKVEAFLLSHPGGYPSTAFLIRHKDDYLLYLGDTSSDFLENEKHLTRLWQRIAPLIREKKLKGMLLECSFPAKQQEPFIFGHLTTHLFQKEMQQLELISQVSLKDFSVVITHRKDSLDSSVDLKEEIAKELNASNLLGLNLIFPTQGDRITL